MSGITPALLQELDVSYDGLIMAVMLFGAFALLSCVNLYSLFIKRSAFLGCYVLFMLAFTTIYIGVSIRFLRVQLIDDQQDVEGTAVWWEVVTDAGFVMNTWMTDGLLLYRCYLIWLSSWMIAILPALLYLGEVATGISFLVFSAHPNASYSTRQVKAFLDPYWCFSLVLNVIVSFLIAGRLLHYRHQQKKFLGPQHTRHYTTIAAVLVESAAIYIGWVAVALAFFIRNSVWENLFIPLLGLVQVIAPNLIIYRLITGRGFSYDDSKEIKAGSTIKFADPPVTQRTEEAKSTYIDSSLLASSQGLGEGRDGSSHSAV